MKNERQNSIAALTEANKATGQYMRDNEYDVPASAERVQPLKVKGTFVSDERERPTSSEHYVSATVIAEHLDIEPRQVLAMTRAGKLPAHAIDPTATRKQWRYKLAEVDAAMHVNRNDANDTGVAQKAARPHNGVWQLRHQKAR